MQGIAVVAPDREKARCRSYGIVCVHRDKVIIAPEPVAPGPGEKLGAAEPELDEDEPGAACREEERDTSDGPLAELDLGSLRVCGGGVGRDGQFALK